LLTRILYFFSKYKWTFLVGIIFVIIANVASSYTINLVGDLINGIKSKITDTSSTIDIIKSEVMVFIAYYLGLTLTSAFFTFLMRQTIIVNSRKIEQHLKDDLYAHIQRLHIAEFKRYPVGDFMSRIAEDIGKIREGFGPAVMYMVNLVTTISVSIFFMLQINSELTWFALFPLPFLSIFIYYFNIYSLQFNKKLQEEMAAMTSVAQESYNGIRIIKSFTLENKVFKSFSAISEVYKNQSLKIVKLDSFFMPIVSLLMGASILIAIYKGGMLAIDGTVDIGGLTAFIMFVNRLLWPVMSIGWVASLIQKGKSALIRYEEIMNLPVEENSPKETSKSNPAKGNIKFENVTYTYPETGIMALDNLSFEIKQGERWLIVGKTGCGKTTLAELLMKFYDDYQGKIMVDGTDLRLISNSFIRQNIAYIPQDVFLFSDTVENNIAFNSDLTISTEVLQAAKDAQIHNEIVRFSNQYQTIVGERGITLSGGQKQRVSIARALIKPSPIYLFDDCLSAVDVETEKKLIEAMNTRDAKSTMLLITHRIFNQLNFDKILVLHDGKLAEKGTHDELLAMKGYYYELYKKQEMSGETHS
jgi:ATP-binding cassette, subfamily B, multidrug efflux pump